MPIAFRIADLQSALLIFAATKRRRVQLGDPDTDRDPHARAPLEFNDIHCFIGEIHALL